MNNKNILIGYYVKVCRNSQHKRLNVVMKLIRNKIFNLKFSGHDFSLQKGSEMDLRNLLITKWSNFVNKCSLLHAPLYKRLDCL